MEKVCLERVGIPGHAWLELRGTVLLLHTQSWLGASSMYVPIEWVSVEHDLRRDLRRLWLALIAFLTAVLLALPSALLLRQPDSPGPDLWLAGVLLGLVALCLVVSVAATVGFLRRRPLIRLRVESEMQQVTVELWRPRNSVALEALLGRLAATHAELEALVSFPIRMHHAWRRPRPYRIALLRGMLISALLYALLVSWDLLIGRGSAGAFPRVLYLILLAPPLAQLAGVALRRALWQDPRSYRRAVAAYLRQRHHEAEALLRDTLEANRDHGPARLLLVQLLTELGRFEEASQQCERLALDHPLLASRLQASLFGIKRLHARMNQADSG